MILRSVIAVALLLTASPVFAQPAPPFAPIADRDLWEAMQKAFADISMPLGAHQQIQQIMANVQREAGAREARARAQTEKPIEPAKP